jgi:hypothetical protein
MGLSPEEDALIGLSSLGQRNFYQHPDRVVCAQTGETEIEARGFPLEIMEALVAKGLAWTPGSFKFALTHEGADRVVKILTTLPAKR